ncbi:esterase/lipase family protein [Pseudomonas sp. TTU2014-080ASC]|uniref:esterase/lipase family protein n=1 Tax=Pseudomonas sp. TTU2014-080ASC TaxID=1729724 RepID=UPI0009EB21E0|nr:alpha/beta fold hydrolase [Pseudomonas sp. TTU2014-080ASC]
MTVPYAFTHLARNALLLLMALTLAGCAGVKVNTIQNEDYLAQRRGDVLSTGELSASARTSLQVVGISNKQCRRNLTECRAALEHNGGVADETRLAALSELWLLEGMQSRSMPAEARINAYLQSARYAFAYLFFTARSTEERALEDRQTQVRDYYNFASQEALTRLFTLYKGRPPQSEHADGRFRIQMGEWTIRGSMKDVRLAEGRQLPKELIPASALSFAGLRNQYRRDGLGAELVAVTRDRVINSRSDKQPWSETPFPALTSVIRFPGKTLDAVLASNTVVLTGYDPYRTSRFNVVGHSVPLAANYTSGYGLWLARSGFARQSMLTLIGRGEVLEAPHVHLLQPYDPNRRIVIMLHGLASSPEAWINVANEVLGDEELRNRYQIWQVYYPTNHPIAFNNRAVKDAIAQTLKHFDPSGEAKASQDVVLIGHSMGGVLSRLLVSSTGDELWQNFLSRHELSSKRRRQAQSKIAPYLQFEPLPQVSRAVFVAAPHRGTPFAENRVSRWASSLVKLPFSVLDRFAEIAQVLVDPNSASPVALNRGFNSIDNLSDLDPFIKATAELPISPTVRYHSIIGNHTPEVPLEQSSDGVVPYSSSHLAGALSEKVIPSWHSVQETPEAILEIRRILHEHLKELAQR